MARGFRGRYFTLAAICATTSLVSISAQASSVENITQNRSFGSEVEYTSDEELEEATQAGVIVIEEQELENNSQKNIYELLAAKNIFNTAQGTNKSAQYIETRGYGLENGSQNILFIIDGVKQKSIDMLAPELANIRLSDVKKIEIIKGGGAVKYGSEANAALVKITTKNGKTPTLYTEIGANGSKKISLGGGIARESFTLDLFGGFYDLSSGIKSNKTEDYTKNKSFSATHRYFFTNGDLTTKLYSSNSDTAYIDPMNKSQFDADPTQDGDTTQDTKSKNAVKGYKLELNYALSEALKSSTTLSYEKRKFTYLSTWWNNVSRYQKSSIRQAFALDGFTFGVDLERGDRKNQGNEFNKNQRGIFLDYATSYEGYSLYLGGRAEATEFKYRKNGEISQEERGAAIEVKAVKDLFGFEHYLGYQKAKITPNIDTFFTYNFATSTYVFNGFIKPQKSDTFEYGLNGSALDTDVNFDAYYIKLNDEIYYNSYTSTNTNLDETKKIGFDIRLKRALSESLSANIGYSFVDARIVQDDYNLSDKKIPGVSPSTVTLGLDYTLAQNFNLGAEYIYKSKYYALSDYKNSLGKIGDAYSICNLRLDYGVKDTKFFIGVKNIFDRKNSLAIYQDKNWAGYTNLDWYYPTDFQREFYAGSEIRF